MINEDIIRQEKLEDLLKIVDISEEEFDKLDFKGKQKYYKAKSKLGKYSHKSKDDKGNGIIFKKEGTKMVEKAKYELDLLLEQCGDDEEARRMQKVINKNLLDLVELFASQGHSGFTANYTIKNLIKLLNQSFITPLTGAEEEWNEVTPGVYQNKRESRIFKQHDRFEGKPYYLDGKAFSDDGGKTWYTNKDSFVTIEFPLYKLPDTEYIILEKENSDEIENN